MGGVGTGQQAYDKIRAGASLVQVQQYHFQIYFQSCLHTCLESFRDFCVFMLVYVNTTRPTTIEFAPLAPLMRDES